MALTNSQREVLSLLKQPGAELRLWFGGYYIRMGDADLGKVAAGTARSLRKRGFVGEAGREACVYTLTDAGRRALEAGAA
jgi:hypothetical protein